MAPEGRGSPAPEDRGGAERGDPPAPGDEAGSGRRLALLALAGLVVVLALVPPLGSLARRYASAEAFQYLLLGLVAPLCVVLAAPWRGVRGRRFFSSLEVARQRHHRLGGAALAIVPVIVVLGIWRAPALVDRLASHPWLLALEAVTLLAAGTTVWLEFVPSPPFAPRLTHLARIPVAAVTMWTLWVLGYAVGLANSDAYPAFARLAHRSLSAAADQQLTAGLLWFVPAVCFIPVAFRNLMGFLRQGGSPAP